jgi:hypothetical protein
MSILWHGDVLIIYSSISSVPAMCPRAREQRFNIILNLVSHNDVAVNYKNGFHVL